MSFSAEDLRHHRSLLMRGFRVVGSHIRRHPLPFAIAVTGAAVYAAATVASAVVLGRVTDTVIVPAFDGGVGAGAVAGGVGAILAVAIVRVGGIVVRRYFAGLTAARVKATLQSQIVDRYGELPLEYHRSHSTGELLAHAEADVEAATEVLHPLPFSTAVVLLIVFASAALIITDPLLAAVGGLIFPVVAILNRIFGAKVERPARRAQERVGDVSSVAHESFDGALVVKTLGREADEVARMEARAEELRRERVRLGRLRAAFEPSFDALPNLGIVVLLAVGSWRVSTGAVTIGTIVQFVSLFQLLAFPMRLIGWVLSEVPRAVVGNDRLEEVFNEPLSLQPPRHGLDLPYGSLGIVAESVAFSHDGRPVLDDVSFEVMPNETVALVGPTAAGKSSLAMLLVRLYDPDRGSIRIGGMDVREIDPGRLRQAVAVVFQESFLFATSVRENIALGAAFSDEEVKEAARLAQADGFISRLPQGYDTVVGERGVTLSGGQRQRVALARALVRRPRILILDDATSSVDPTIEAAILKGLRDEVSTTTIVVAYRVSTIALADRVLFIHGGRIAAHGTHEQLLGYPAYEVMVRAYETGAA